jgi:thiamine-phosphate pyrophosphorylase
MTMSLEPQSRARRKLIAAARIAARALPEGLPPALFVTDPARTPDPERIVAGLPKGWGVIYRHFGAADRAEVAASLAKLCRARGLKLLIAADPLLAVKVGADGVHWPFRLRRQMRRWHGRFRLQTLSAHSAGELRAAARLPVNGALVSAVFPSRSPSAGKAMGALKFRKLAREAHLPVYALGGVTAGTARTVAAVAGFASVDAMAPFGGGPRT